MKEEIRDFLDYITHERKYSIHTIEAYSKDLGEFSAYAEESYSIKELQEITHFHIRSWLTQMLKKDIASSTVKRKVSSLKSFYKFLLKRNLIQSNPMDKVVAPKVKKSLPKFVDQRSLNELIDSIQFDASSFKSVQDRLILLVFYHTGIRRAELINLKEKDVDLLTSSLKVMGKGGKERIIPFSSELLKELRAYFDLKKKATDSIYVFSNKKGGKLYPKYVYNAVNQFLQVVGSASQKSPHIIRHSFATNLLNNGADINAIKELLGHASLNATQIYTQNSIEELKSIHKLTHPKS